MVRDYLLRLIRVYIRQGREDEAMNYLLVNNYSRELAQDYINKVKIDLHLQTNK